MRGLVGRNDRVTDEGRERMRCGELVTREKNKGVTSELNVIGFGDKVYRGCGRQLICVALNK